MPLDLFIDEMDSLGSREQVTGGRNSIYQTEVINAVLEQIRASTRPRRSSSSARQIMRERGSRAPTGRAPGPRHTDPARPNSDPGSDHIYQYYIGQLGGTAKVDPGWNAKLAGSFGGGDRGGRRTDRPGNARRRARVRRAARCAQVDLIAEITNKPRGTSGALRLNPDELERTATHEAGHALARS